MYRLHCFSQSGNCFKVAFALRAMGAPWESVFVDFMRGITRDPAWRADANEMGEVPVLDDGARRLTQSGVILQYLARKHGRFDAASEDDALQVQRWLFFDNHKFTSYFATYRFMKAFGPQAPDPAVMAWLRPRVEAAFGIVERHLADRPYIVGDAPTIADFSMCGYLFYPKEESGIDITAGYPHIASWLDRLRRIDGWASPYEVLPGAQLPPRW